MSAITRILDVLAVTAVAAFCALIIGTIVVTLWTSMAEGDYAVAAVVFSLAIVPACVGWIIWRYTSR